MPVTPLESLVAAGTKLWLDSIDPDEVAANRAYGATGATSNPIIIADLIKTGRFDDLITQYLGDGLDDETLAWKLTDHLVSRGPGRSSCPSGTRPTATTATSASNSTRSSKTPPASCRSPSARRSTSSWARSGPPATPTA